MGSSTIALGLGLGGGKAATSSGRPGGGGTPFANEYSLNFDGTDDYVDCGDDSSLEPANVTISAWVKATGSIGAFNYILSKLGAYYGTFHLRYTSANKFGFFIGLGTSGANVQGLSSSTYTLTEWNHVVLTYDKVNLKLYVNGSEDFSQAETRDILYLDVTSPYPGKDLTIGKGPFPDPAQGLIDEVSYFGSALSASDIAAIYNGGTPVDLGTDGLNLSPVGWWRMGDGGTWDGSNWTIPDASENDNAGTTANMAEASRSTDTPYPRYSTKSVDFDGSNGYVAIGSSGDLGSLSAWFKPDSVISASSTTRNLCGFTGVGTYAAYGGISFASTAGVVTNEIICIYTGDWVYAYSHATETISTDWHHLAIRWTGSDYEIWLDGVEKKNDEGQNEAGAKVKLPISAFNIGRRNSDRYFAGLIDEVAIWDDPISAADITAIYNSGSPASLASYSPDGWWKLGDGTENGSGTTIYDMSDNSNNGTLTGGTAYSADTI